MTLLLVVLGGFHGFVHDLEHIRADQIPLTQHSDAGAVPIQYIAVEHQLLQLDLGQLHEALNLVLGAVVVLNAEGIDRDSFHAAFVAYLEHLRESRRGLAYERKL